MLQKTNQYQSCVSVDLRCFDNTQPDMGVRKYLEKLGFVPHRIFNHETYMDQIHTHTGAIDDAYLEPQWVAQRAVPGAQTWTKRQFKMLIDQLHLWKIEFYQGCEAAWSCWPEYGEINKCTYLYEHLSETFIVNRNGVTTGEGGMGGINPLRRFRDGRLYEDLILQDLSRFLVDYECDGFFAADGFVGLVIPLENGCYGDDMIEQFTEYTGIVVPQGSTPERADYIWEHLRGEWASFYADRWAAFHRKLSEAMKKIGKKLTTFTPFQMGPADALLMFGIDYRKSYEAGLRSVALEIMEEVTSRRFQICTGWESVGIANATTAKVVGEDMEILWTVATCNSPEHWNTMRDQSPILERECLSLPTLQIIKKDGTRQRAIDGYLPIFGNDLSKEEWSWLHRRMEEGFGYQVQKQLGPVILWSDKILYHHIYKGSVWPLSAIVSKLRHSGVALSQATELSNVSQLEAGECMLLAQPLGIDRQDAALIAQSVRRGVHLVVVGEVENEELLALLGICRQPCEDQARRWCSKDEKICGCEYGMGGYVPQKDAVSLVDVEGGYTALCTHRVGDGTTVYIRRIPDLPPVDLHKTKEEERCYPIVMETLGLSGFQTVREQMESVCRMHADRLDVYAGRVIQQLQPRVPAPHRGQIVAFETDNQTDMLILENSTNLMYTTTHVQLGREKLTAREFPEIAPCGTTGYMFFGDTSPCSLDVSLPPDGAIPVLVRYR